MGNFNSRPIYKYFCTDLFKHLRFADDYICEPEEKPLKKYKFVVHMHELYMYTGSKINDHKLFYSDRSRFRKVIKPSRFFCIQAIEQDLSNCLRLNNWSRLNNTDLDENLYFEIITIYTEKYPTTNILDFIPHHTVLMKKYLFALWGYQIKLKDQKQLPDFCLFHLPNLHPDLFKKLIKNNPFDIGRFKLLKPESILEWVLILKVR